MNEMTIGRVVFSGGARPANQIDLGVGCTTSSHVFAGNSPRCICGRRVNDEAPPAASTPPSEQPGDSEAIRELRATLAQVTAERDGLRLLAESRERIMVASLDERDAANARAEVSEEKVRALEAALRLIQPPPPPFDQHVLWKDIEAALLSPSPDTGKETQP
jgi:hypothetical protein